MMKNFFQLTDGQNNIEDSLKAAYNGADKLFDRRFEDFNLGNLQPRSKRYKTKVQSLYQHLNRVKNTYRSYCENRTAEDNGNLDILYHLTIGNICMRIGQWHLDNYHYELADYWHGMATDAFWQGMNKVKGISPKDETTSVYFYRLLLMLNLGKCSRNFARQNRRSDFLAAKEKFQHIQKEIDSYLESGGNMSRELALIGADASINIARVNRHMYRSDSGKEELFCILKSLSKRENDGNEDVFLVRIIGNRIEVSSHQMSVDYTVNGLLIDSDFECKTISDFECRNKTIINIFKGIDKEDLTHIVPQVLIELGLLLRKERRYIDAINTFIVANLYDTQNNVDAINNISSALRKLITTSDTEPEILDNLINSINEKVAVKFTKFNQKTLIKQLVHYARLGNLYALREFVRWHCDCIGPKHKKMDGLANKVGIETDNPLNCLRKGLDKIVKAYDSFAKNTEPATRHVKQSDDIAAIIQDITLVIEANLRLSKSYSDKENIKNAQLLYLRGCVELQFRQYDRAIETFMEVCSRKESEYIRRGTLGLKAGYQLARCYISRAEFRKALNILREIRDTLKGSQKGGNADSDFRVERDYGYCLMRLGSYEEADQVYQEIYNIINTESDTNYSSHQNISFLNNYAVCLLHRGEVRKVQEILEEILELDKNDRTANLLWGYYHVCQSDRLTAQEYFDKSYDQNYDQDTGFYGSAQLYTPPDQVEERRMVERRSAYIINLTQISGDLEEKTQKEVAQEKVISFLSDISPACTLSLNATIALAEWLCKWASQTESDSALLIHLYRSFASISVYPERGACAFMTFKADSKFQYFRSDERGRILIRLFAMYRYIKKIKEKLSCSSSGEKHSDHLVHYTSLETLKVLLSEKSADPTSPPRFRVSNCGYMNDVFEGSVFLEKMRKILVSNNESNAPLILQNWDNMVKKYFPHLVRSVDNMIPVGRSVYIASLSSKPDSFPLWSIYAKNETGCNIEFSKHFFDIFEASKSPEVLQDYLISEYTDHDYPVYSVKYLSDEASENESELDKLYEAWREVDQAVEDLEKKYCGEEGKSEDNMLKGGINAIYTFAADLINEVRFLFKDADYQYEGEARVVVTASTQAKIDETMSPPRAYAIVNRTIDNVSVRLGSKIDDPTVDQLVTWLKLTGKVREVKLSKRNRRTINSNFN